VSIQRNQSPTNNFLRISRNGTAIAQ